MPGSKEEIFKSKDLSLIDKRKLMRFLMFAAGEFESAPEFQGKGDMGFETFLKEIFTLNPQLASVLTCALAFCEKQFGAFRRDELISVIPTSLLRSNATCLATNTKLPSLVGAIWSIPVLSRPVRWPGRISPRLLQVRTLLPSSFKS